MNKVVVPPNSKESEMMVLGCMLTNVNSLNAGADGLNEFDFYYTEHQIIFQALKTAYVNDKPADIHLIAEELKRTDKLSAVGGIGYLTALAQYVGTSVYIEEYIELVQDKSLLRKMIHAAQEVEKTALHDPEDAHAILDEAQNKFFIISQAANPTAGIHIKDLLSGVKASSELPYLKELQERQEQFKLKGPEEAGITGIPTHYIDLDKMINGLNRSNLMILAARPAMGKSALALNIAENVCFKHGMPVAIFSLEMSAEQLLHRLICSQSEVESDKIKTGNLSGTEFQRIVASVNAMQKCTMIIDDQPGLKITDLRARARRLKESHGVQFIVVDYLQLLSGSGLVRTSENRQNEISEISRMLKNLARELDIPILCLSQLSRKVEERAGHRPMMSDLRESGCLGADTLIKDAETGKMYTIKELADRKTQTPLMIHAIDDHLKLGKYAMTKVFYSGKKVVYELKTRTGRSIKASANHPFRKLEGWVRLDALKKGDRIGLPRSLHARQQSSHLDPEEIKLLAHLLGDGCILPTQPYHYTSADKENIQTVRTAANQLFGIQARVVSQKNWFHVYLPSPYQTTHAKYHPITLWFEKLKIDRVRSYDKKIPEAILQCDGHDIALFLKHLWATDGNISFKHAKGRKAAGSIYYASSSKALSKQTQHLLLNLGIQSTLRMVPSAKGYRNMYHVAIQGTANQTLFLKKVNSSGQRGQTASELLEQLAFVEANPNCDIIPKEAWKTVIKEAKDEQHLGWRDVCSGMESAYCGSSLFKRGISRQRMQTLSNVLPNQKLIDLAESDVYWDEIVSIEPVGMEDVYDATVPGVHNFVANDIIVHNSIEQDSDIVMFLLRREYYDPHDKPGMAELIVAKNRHGGVGSVNMAFRKELAQFANYSGLHASAASQGARDAFAAFSPRTPVED